ncbi:MAG: hypothetical protein J6Y82_10045 [Bacteroidales bacterium]|nr:hypothetical protein [Bacteroidales bacterium]
MKNIFKIVALLACAAAVPAQNAPENQIKTVDLGLPSGTLWTTQNLGARYTADYGDCFAWGETVPKEYFSWKNYKYSDGTSTGITKYDTDGKRTLEASDDPATVILGPSFSTPTKAQWEELLRECIWIWTYSVNGRMAHGYMVYKAKTQKDKGRFIIFRETDGRNNDAPITTEVSYLSYCDPYIFIPASEHNKYKNPTFWRFPYGCYWSNEILGDETKTAFRVEFDNQIHRLGRNTFRDEAGFVRAVQQAGSQTDIAESDIRPIQESKNAKTGKGEVDLGLPSRTLWATCNVGAENPWDSGDYFAWGETTPKTDYSWTTYKYCQNPTYTANETGQTGTTFGTQFTTFTKYVLDKNYGNVDEKTLLEPADDAATANLGAKYSTPTVEEWQELEQNCYWVWTDNYRDKGVGGFIVYKAKSTADKGVVVAVGGVASDAYKPTDKHIFLPAAGSCTNNAVTFIKSNLFYWTSSQRSDIKVFGSESLGPDFHAHPYLARKFNFNTMYEDFRLTLDTDQRCTGMPVRAVRRK